MIEKSDYLGGIARTVAYKGNRIDLGGHRFFSKSDRVMAWWLHFLPLEANADESFRIAYQGQSRTFGGARSDAAPDPDREDRVMLVRSRKSRIYYLRQFFDYPISLSPDTVKKLGFWRTLEIGISYLRVVVFPIRPEGNLEEFFINRFGRELYRTFFKDYTEKVWGVSCREISAEWGAQRIKGLSILRAVVHFTRGLFSGRRDVTQKGTETSLIERFLYPKLGPGQMWETVAEDVRRRGAEIRMRQEIVKLEHDGGRIAAATVRDAASGRVERIEADLYFSTMPIRNLVEGLEPPAPHAPREIAAGLVYRDFLTVGLLCRRLAIGESAATGGSPQVTDNWIYIQEPDVKVGRLQIFNNW
ncbi:MAG: FAD-dependent oxidoreductase, partial [Candidatus Binatia bacterium]